MSFDFPNSPTNGQVFAPTGGPVYVYTGGVWRMQGSGQVVTAEARNRLVNPAFQIRQEYDQLLSALGGYYPADQWMFSHPGPNGYWTYGPVASPTPNGSPIRLRMTCVTPKGSLAAADFVTLRQYIEGLRVSDFGWGTAAAKPIVIRFGFKGPAGTYSVNVFNSPTGNRTYVAQFTITAAQANTDTEQIVAIPGDTTGTWVTTNAASIALLFTLAAGSNFVGSLGWNASNVLIAAGNSNGWAAAGVFEIFDVGLHLDRNGTGVPPPWEMPDEPEEFRLCQRYFCKADIDQTYHGLVASVTQWYEAVRFPVTMRANPTMSGGTMTGAIYNQAGAVSNAATLTMSAQSVTAGRVNVSFTGTSITGMVPQAQAISATARM